MPQAARDAVNIRLKGTKDIRREQRAYVNLCRRLIAGFVTGKRTAIVGSSWPIDSRDRTGFSSCGEPSLSGAFARKACTIWFCTKICIGPG